MNVLRKEKPSNTEEVARDLEERRRNFSRPEIVDDPVDRRPPQSVTPAAANPAVTETALPERTAPASQPPAAGQAEANLPSTRTRKPDRQSQSMDGRYPLFDESALRDFRSRWDQVQTSFVDEPHRAVEQADALVATVIQRVSDQFSQERSRLEEQSAGGTGAASTEDLRQRFQRYRAFFDRLLAF